MKNTERRFQGILEATGCEFKMSFKAAELSYKEDNKKFGECGRKSYTNLTGKDLELELASKMQSCKLDLAVFVQGFKELVEKSCEPVEEAVAPEKVEAPTQAPEKVKAAYPLSGNIKCYTDEELELMIRSNSFREVAKWIRRVLYTNNAKKAARQIVLDELELEVEMSSIGRLVEILRAASNGNDITGSLPLD